MAPSSHRRLEIARRELRVGNLYLNRGVTGAVVRRQPFGGIKLSGAGWKAGGPDYLKQFLESRTVSENTRRHGFAPEIGQTGPSPNCFAGETIPLRRGQS